MPLIPLFNELFQTACNTVLEPASTDPYYLPADESSPYNRVQYAHGFFASALHEVSHWCLAGERRRQLVDFGYWYKPDRQLAADQLEFERLEIKPQALEWIFTVATKKDFFVSADNLNFQEWDLTNFRQEVRQQALHFLQDGLSSRAESFLLGLKKHYQSFGHFEDFWQQVRTSDQLPG